MLKAASFDTFAYACPFSYTFGQGNINGGYNCRHPLQTQKESVGYKGKKKAGCCYCFSCPLGIEAEQQDLTDPFHPDAVTNSIDWDGLDADGIIEEGEILLIETGNEASEDQKSALWNYEKYINRYNKKWLDEHGIDNNLCG